jgi:hypothetical protein
MSYNNNSVIVFSAGLDVSLGNFKKRITNYTILWHDTSYTPIPARIEAEDCNFMSSMPNIYPNVCEDEDGNWAISSSKAGNWIEYYIDVPSAGHYLFNIRYAATKNNILTIKDNQTSCNMFLYATDGIQKWTSTDTVIYFSEGKHKLLFKTNSDVLNINWFELSKTTSVNNLKRGKELLVIPNPVTNNMFAVTLPESDDGKANYQIRLYDANGRICYSTNWKNDGAKQLYIHLSDNTVKGLYTLHIYNEKNDYRQKIIIQ